MFNPKSTFFHRNIIILNRKNSPFLIGNLQLFTGRSSSKNGFIPALEPPGSAPRGVPEAPATRQVTFFFFGGGNKYRQL